MLSSDSCNYCYCIRGIKHCVQPKCRLAVEHCQPRFSSSFDCCPASYSCSENVTSTAATTTTTVTSPPTTTATPSTTTRSTAAPVIVPIQGCWKRGQLYRVGEAIPASTDCEACYCSPAGPTCHRIECPPVALHCEPVIPKGHCCPTKYICNKTSHEAAEGGRPVFEVLGSHRNAEKYREPQVASRRSDEDVDYGTLPKPAYMPSTNVPPSVATVYGVHQTDLFNAAHDVDGETHSSLSTTTESPPTKSPPTESPATKSLPPKSSPMESPPPKSSPTESPHTNPPHHEPHVIYVPEQIRTDDGGKIMAEMKIVMNPDSSHPADKDNVGQEEGSTAQDLPPPVSLEGLQFSELIDRVFLARQEENEKDDNNERVDVLSPLYGHTNSTSAFGTSLTENEELRPVYGSPPAFSGEGAQENPEMLKPLYGSPPTFVEGVPKASPSVTETVAEEIHYEPAMSLDVNASSVYAAASGEDAATQNLETTPKINEESLQPTPKPQNETKPKPLEFAAVNQSRESLNTDDLVPTTQNSFEATEMRAETRSTTLPTLEALATTMPSEETSPSTHESSIHDSSKEAPNKAEVTPAEPTQGNDTLSTMETAMSPPRENETLYLNSSTLAMGMNKSTENNETSGDTIKVEVGSTLNVMDAAQGFRDTSDKPRIRKVEEDGVIFGALSDLGTRPDPPKDVGDSPRLAESREISSGGHSTDVRGIPSVQRLFVKPTEVVRSGQEKDEQPEVITAPNFDFSGGESITVALSPGNSFKVASLLNFDKPELRTTTTSTPPSVDTAPWAPLSISDTEAKQKPKPDYAEATEESKHHSVLHSSFRIVPFLAEDAIFKPLGTETATQNKTSPSSLPRIAINTNPREPVKDNCFVGGKMFVNGELIEKEDPCDLCRCYYGQELCQKKSCPPPPSPACFTERVPGFCCPKYTCRPEDVLITPESSDDTDETPRPGGFVVHQYRGGHFSSLPRPTAPPSDRVTLVKSDPSDDEKRTTKRPFSPKEPPLQRTIFSKTTPTPVQIATLKEPKVKPTTKPATEPATKLPGAPNSVWSILQVSGCNIYGRLYGVNEVVPELSGQCKACTCTALGVQCNRVC